MNLTKKYVSVTGAADIIGCTTGRVRQLLLEGTLQGEKLQDSQTWIVSRASAEKYAAEECSVGRKRRGARDE